MPHRILIECHDISRVGFTRVLSPARIGKVRLRMFSQGWPRYDSRAAVQSR
jgi:hypothetical protein